MSARADHPRARRIGPAILARIASRREPRRAIDRVPWHSVRKPYLRRLRLRLEALLGSKCAFCGATRADGVNLQFHHHAGRDWSPRKLSWSQRLHRYHAEIKSGAIQALACDQSGRNCHERCKREAPAQPVKLYDHPDQPF